MSYPNHETGNGIQSVESIESVTYTQEENIGERLFALSQETGTFRKTEENLNQKLKQDPDDLLYRFRPDKVYIPKNDEELKGIFGPSTRKIISHPAYRGLNPENSSIIKLWENELDLREKYLEIVDIVTMNSKLSEEEVESQGNMHRLAAIFFPPKVELRTDLSVGEYTKILHKEITQALKFKEIIEENTSHKCALELGSHPFRSMSLPPLDSISDMAKALVLSETLSNSELARIVDEKIKSYILEKTYERNTEAVHVFDDNSDISYDDPLAHEIVEQLGSHLKDNPLRRECLRSFFGSSTMRVLIPLGYERTQTLESNYFSFVLGITSSLDSWKKEFEDTSLLENLLNEDDLYEVANVWLEHLAKGMYDIDEVEQTQINFTATLDENNVIAEYILENGSTRLISQLGVSETVSVINNLFSNRDVNITDLLKVNPRLNKIYDNLSLTSNNIPEGNLDNYIKQIMCGDIEPRLDQAIYEKVHDYIGLNYYDLEVLLQNDIDLSVELDEHKLKEIFEILAKQVEEWGDEITAGNFKECAEIFGYRKAFNFINREGLSKHDALHTFGDIIALYEASELESNDFYNNILQQVSMDKSGYTEGTAHHHLNAIAQATNPNIAEVIAKAQEYKDIERLQKLAATFDSPQAVFASWASLKRYSELEQLLGKTEILNELKELKTEGKEKLYQYIETLAFHPDSKVNMEAVIQFWRNPEYFLAGEASHTPQEVQDRKKPSNYINMPNLDLTAAELRDALVEGKMDAIQAFSPFEIRYKIPVVNYEPEPLVQVVSKALGSRKEGVAGASKNPGKLFSKLNTLLKTHGTNAVSYLQGEELPDTVDLVGLEELVYNQDFGMERPQIQTREFVARISKKSDPNGAIAGDDTVNCMPFGDGKNTVYTFNPNTAQLVIRLVKEDGKERTIAQSVLTKDMDVKASVPDVISKLQQEGSHLEDVLPGDILRNAPTYVAGDNVEVSPNFSDQRYQEIIAAIMRDYFREYMGRYAETQGLDPTKVPIGQGYTDALSELPTAPNTYAPQAPVSYSDKTGARVFMLDLATDEELSLIMEKSVTTPEVTQNTQPDLPDMPGIDYLTFEDSLRVGYLEGKAYADNESLMQFLFNMENALIAKDINNSAKNRPNMSLKYTDSEGKMSGYFLSWEGKLTDEYVQYNAEDYYDQPCVYMMDLATDLEDRMAGGRLIRAFTELYKQNYLDKDNPIPIFAQARETTSFRIIQRQLERLGREAGTEFELIELPTYDEGEDTMHPVIIQPKVSLA